MGHRPDQVERSQPADKRKQDDGEGRVASEGQDDVAELHPDAAVQCVASM